MGNKKSKPKQPPQSNSHSKEPVKDYSLIQDRFNSYKDLEEGLRKAGLESSQLIIGVDFTKSNTWQGGKPFYADKNLHAITPYPNPYQKVLEIMCKTLEPFDEDHLIPAFGFGDTKTKDHSVFSFAVKPKYDNSLYTNISPETQQFEDTTCYQLSGVLESYNKLISDIDNGYLKMSGPTTFAPLINKAIEIVKHEKEYHILLIICDGDVDNVTETVDAIVRASKYALSIICVGVGKGPWDRMIEFDDEIPERDFDNFRFVDFHKIMQQCENEELEFAKHALAEIPKQYHYIKKHILK